MDAKKRLFFFLFGKTNFNNLLLTDNGINSLQWTNSTDFGDLFSFNATSRRGFERNASTTTIVLFSYSFYYLMLMNVRRTNGIPTGLTMCTASKLASGGALTC